MKVSNTSIDSNHPARMNALLQLGTGRRLNDARETEKLGRHIGETVAPGTAIGLHGGLGAGKTTLAKGIAAGWGVTESVKSPTFNYFLLYRTGRGTFAHLDAYRIRTESEYDSLLLEEMLGEEWLLVIEWAERILNRLPPETVHLHLSRDADPGRLIRAVLPGSSNTVPRT